MTTRRPKRWPVMSCFTVARTFASVRHGGEQATHFLFRKPLRRLVTGAPHVTQGFVIMGFATLIITLQFFGCAAPRPPVVVPSAPFDEQAIVLLCGDVWRSELGREIDPSGLAACLDAARNGRTREQIKAGVHDSPEAVAYRGALAHPPAAMNAGEHGPLRVEGLRILTDQGAEWRYAGFTDFRLFYRFVQGDDIQPLLTERIGYGANTLRVLLIAAALFDQRPEAFTDGQLDAFLDLLATRGLRCECVLLVDANPAPENNLRGTLPTYAAQQSFLDRIAPILRRHWNAIGELCNECDHGINRVDPLVFTKPAGPTLWERGSQTADAEPVSPPWDLIGDHPGRVDEWPRRINCKDIRTNANVPCVENEPMGAAEVDEPGRRATRALDFAQWGAVCGLLSNGCLFHSSDGIASQPLGPVQAAAARAFFAGMAFIPTNAASWPYQRGDAASDAGIGNMPMKHSDALALRTFCKSNDAESWCVAVRPTGDWNAVARENWRITDQPIRGLVRLER